MSMAWITKRDRKDFKPDYSLYNNLQWSTWKDIVVPSPPSTPGPYEKRGIAKGRPLEGYRVAGAALKSVIPVNGGIYELGLYKPGTAVVPAVVYVGKAKSLQKRILLYCYDGSHKRDKLDDTLKQKYCINVRYFQTTSFDIWECQILGDFKYEWNVQIPRRLPNIRRDITGRYDPSCPFPSAYDENNDDGRIQELLEEDKEKLGPYVPTGELVLRNNVAYSHPLFHDWSGQWSDCQVEI